MSIGFILTSAVLVVINWNQAVWAYITMSIKSENSIRWADLLDTDVLLKLINSSHDLFIGLGRIVPQLRVEEVGSVVSWHFLPLDVEEEVSSFLTSVNFLVVGGTVCQSLVDLKLSLGVGPVR